MSLKSTVIGLVALLAIGAGVFVGLNRPATPMVGSVTGDTSYFPCETHNGVQSCFARAALKTATTTVCAIKSPTSTSTLATAGVRIGTASSTISIWDIARATSAFATTTAIGTTYTIAANAAADIVSSTSPAGGSAAVFPPNTYLVVGVRNTITPGDTAGTGSNTAGYCSAKFDVL